MASPEFDRLFAGAYDDLRDIARRHLRQERDGHTLNTTGLVHEAYVKLARRRELPAGEAALLRARVSTAMRQILIDHARARAAGKRGGGAVHVTLRPSRGQTEPRTCDVLDLDGALTRLGVRDPRLEQVVECHFFGGMSKQETAAALGVSVRTVERDWVRARAYLQRLLEPIPS
jgi:RNA polymerase sigma-70 factor, ECF subfamily